MQRTPPALVERARALLRRMFSGAAWRIEDDTALASIVGPGAGTSTVDLGNGLYLQFGWRAGAFRVEASLNDETGSAAPVATTPSVVPQQFDVLAIAAAPEENAPAETTEPVVV